MFDKILIANRGEIAVRVARTAADMGVRTVAIYSDADADALHVQVADQAVHIGGAAPADSYLRGDRIIQAALDTGAQAIHPGYGFLSENPDFVQAVQDAGLVFIGPSADAIRAMGLKDAAKALMEQAGVPVVPGYHGDNQDPEHLSGAADTIGYPVLIKAVAGGGGKGMRKVDRPADFQAALASARAEAKGAFGNDAVLIEKFVSQPRHIEVQVFGDGTRAVHLFERDCSLQRRHQKVIEEAPAPGMTDDMRAAMGQAAVRAAEAIGYSGAGTVEFIVDGSQGLRPDRFYFMEMNTRLQVEHPVTEYVTGIDLVAWQLRVAAGEPLPVAQDDLTLTGHAFEARLYAEDVPKGFLPATGTLEHLQFPSGTRADTGVRAGDVISPYYDPMIAKLIVWGDTRDVALAKLDRALSQTQVGGTVTNLAFLRALTRHQGFKAGDVDTGLIDRDLEALSVQPEPCSRAQSLAALGAMGLHQGVPEFAGFSLWGPVAQTVEFGHQDRQIVAIIKTKGSARPEGGREAPALGGGSGAVRCFTPGGVFDVTIGEITHHIEQTAEGWRIDGQSVRADVITHDSHVSVFWGNGYTFDLIDPLARDTAAGAGGNVIEAPMPGLVKMVGVTVGADVSEGDRLAILEAMKMEHSMTAPRSGKVAEVLVTEGTQVEAGQALIRLEEDA
ncbi:acetyl/propionyl/methylcrotonyl-CoA carboxylase subunit alpha [Parasulfitobacter algicola]|uniref:Acetyl/propionyl/methylcrotonyl-CoA carboxylase subunit alpha n=1 Tax=Parasulfitobacter algicola TaxID=2614809 RepID=A0ABX2ISJ3_9RHOB|nr:acetyl/propionyl/methylcrotonyl-CoA carboxylase subunit alpha [Sulfitobacter algicola]NSX55879.1 acetyl/propionyl/methylcrotonyl-CoA carboxylase subunit alpha [Sulfitobacter algicola]